jgi:hypothetical protein
VEFWQVFGLIGSAKDFPAADLKPATLYALFTFAPHTLQPKLS